MNEQLPDGLRLAGIDGPFNACMYRDDCRAERDQRLTLQHHAADQAQRIADLEAKCTTLKELHDAAADERDAAQLLADGTGADAYAHCCDNVEAWRRKRGHETSGPEGSLCNWVDWAMGVADERDALRARLAEIEAQDPVAQVVDCPDDSHSLGISVTASTLERLGVGSKLYARPITAQAAPDADAERYRWLKTRPVEVPTDGPDLALWSDSCGDALRGDAADAAIDDAMATGLGHKA